MRDKAHVRLVDAHAEGNGCDHDQAVFAQKARLVVGPRALLKTGVIGQRLKPGHAQSLGGFLDLASRHAVDDAGLATELGEKGLQLRARISTRAHRIADIRPVEATDEPFGLAEREACGNIDAGAFVGSSGQRHARHAGEMFGQGAEFEIILAEVVAPLRYAMGFVDSDQRNPRAGERLQGARLQHALGRDIEQS